MGDHAYWSNVVPPARWVDMALKYDALARLAVMDPDARPPALRSAARAWPGALREAELAGPAVCRRRGRIAHVRVCWPGSTRSEARGDDDLFAVMLWADLHLLLADQLGFRRRYTRSDASSAANREPRRDAHAFVASLSGAARSRWPDPDLLVERGGAKVRPRQAYLWLATRAGLSLVQLNRLLFARAGHWDRRDDDPEWARIG